MFNFLKTAGVALLVVASSALAADVRILTLRDLAVTESSCVEGVGRKLVENNLDLRLDKMMPPQIASSGIGPASYEPITWA